MHDWHANHDFIINFQFSLSFSLLTVYLQKQNRLVVLNVQFIYLFLDGSVHPRKAARSLFYDSARSNFGRYAPSKYDKMEPKYDVKNTMPRVALQLISC